HLRTFAQRRPNRFSVDVINGSTASCIEYVASKVLLVIPEDCGGNGCLTAISKGVPNISVHLVRKLSESEKCAGILATTASTPLASSFIKAATLTTLGSIPTYKLADG